MAFDYSKLLGRIIEKFGTRKALCAKIGMSESALSSRLSNKTNFSMDEIFQLIQPDCLDIAIGEIGVYFYTPKFD